MEDLQLTDPVEWEAEAQSCVLCEHADDAGSAMGYLQQMDKALGGRTTDKRLAQMMLESYNTFFYDPAVKAGESRIGLMTCRRCVSSSKSIRIPTPP